MAGRRCRECGATDCAVGSGISLRGRKRPSDASTMSLCELIATQDEKKHPYPVVPGWAMALRNESCFSPEDMRVLQEHRYQPEE